MSGSSQSANVDMELVCAGVLPAVAADGVVAPNTINCQAVAVASTDWQLILASPCPGDRRIVMGGADSDVGEPFTLAHRLNGDSGAFITTVSAAGAATRAPIIRFAIFRMPSQT